jgi:hypothetical protein
MGKSWKIIEPLLDSPRFLGNLHGVTSSCRCYIILTGELDGGKPFRRISIPSIEHEFGDMAHMALVIFPTLFIFFNPEICEDHMKLAKR